MIAIAEQTKSKDILPTQESNSDCIKPSSLDTKDKVNCEEKVNSSMIVEDVANNFDTTTVVKQKNSIEEQVINSTSLEESNNTLLKSKEVVETRKDKSSLSNFKETIEVNIVESITIDSKEINKNKCNNIEERDDRTHLVDDRVSAKNINGIVKTSSDLNSKEDNPPLLPKDPLSTTEDSPVSSPTSLNLNISSIAGSLEGSPVAANSIAGDTPVASPATDIPIASSINDNLATTNGLTSNLLNGDAIDEPETNSVEPPNKKIKIVKDDNLHEIKSDIILDPNDSKQCSSSETESDSVIASIASKLLPLVIIEDEEVKEIKATEVEKVKTGQKRLIEDDLDCPRQSLKRVRIFKNSSLKLSQDSTQEADDSKPLMISKCETGSSNHEEKLKVSKVESNKKTATISKDKVDHVITKDLENCKKLKEDKKLHRISRKDLEKIVIQLFADKLLYEHELGRQRDLCKRLEATLEGNRKKAASFHKEIDDLQKVTQRLQAEYSARKGQVVAPVKVKRSVGIHVTPNIISKGITSSESVLNNVRFISPSKEIRSTEKQQKTEKRYKNGTVTKETVSQPTTKTQAVAPAVKTNKTVVSPVTKVTSTTTTTIVPSKSKTGFIDLTDDEENKVTKSILKTTLTSGGNMVAIPRQAINLAQSGQFVALPQSSVNSLLLVPQSAATLVVSSVANSLQKVGGVSPAIRAPLSIGANANPTRLILASPMAQKAILAAQASVPRHPAELPKAPPQQTAGFSKSLPPQPILNLSHKDNTGIVLLWKMSKTDEHEAIASYQLYAYQEGSAPPVSSLWKRVGSVKALELPMACTLTQFMSGHTYHFAVRAVDIRNRLGPFSEPKSIRLKN